MLSLAPDPCVSIAARMHEERLGAIPPRSRSPHRERHLARASGNMDLQVDDRHMVDPELMHACLTTDNCDAGNASSLQFFTKSLKMY